MRFGKKKTLKMAVPALAAAALATWTGVPSAHAGFVVSWYGNGPVETIDTGNGVLYQDYVLQAYNDNAASTPSSPTGTTFYGADVIIQSSAPLGIDVEANTVAGSPVTNPSNTYTVNIDGSMNDTNPNLNSKNATGPSTFGDATAGTFVGIGNGAFDPTFVSSQGESGTPVTTQLGTQKVYINSQVPSKSVANAATAVYSGALSAIDPQFENSGSVDGSINNIGTKSKPNFVYTSNDVSNGNITALEVDTADTLGNGKGNPLDTNPNAPIPFLNLVVPVGTTGTVSGLLGGETGLNVPFSINFPVAATSGSVSLSLTNAAPSGSNQIASITMSGHNGSYVPQSVAVTGAAQTKGYLEVSGFTAGDAEIYALTATPGSGETLAALIAELNTAVAASDAGAQAVAVTPSIAHLFPTADIEVDIPGGDGANPAFLAYDLTGDTSGPTISAIGVVPEPTSIGFLVVGGLGLLARRRRAM